MAAAVLVARRSCAYLPVLYNYSKRKSFMYDSCFASRKLLHFTRHAFAELKFSQTHEWIQVEEGIGTVGITDHAQEQLGEIVYVELPEVGLEVKKDADIGILESVKAANDFYAPASGEVCEVNSKLEDDPGLVNRSPHEDGWLVKIKLSEEENVMEVLMSEIEYEQFVKDSEDNH